MVNPEHQYVLEYRRSKQDLWKRKSFETEEELDQYMDYLYDNYLKVEMRKSTNYGI